MPRTQVVTLNGKQITVKESKIKELREELIPKISNIAKPDELTGKDVKDLIPLFESKIAEIIPEITEADIEESYPSEIEALIEAWVNVNFTGLKRLYRPLMSLMSAGFAK